MNANKTVILAQMRAMDSASKAVDRAHNNGVAAARIAAAELVKDRNKSEPDLAEHERLIRMAFIIAHDAKLKLSRESNVRQYLVQALWAAMTPDMLVEVVLGAREAKKVGAKTKLIKAADCTTARDFQAASKQIREAVGAPPSNNKAGKNGRGAKAKAPAAETPKLTPKQLAKLVGAYFARDKGRDAIIKAFADEGMTIARARAEVKIVASQ